jgi:hypothetical protein
VSSTDIRYCYYHETHKILGNTFGICVLQVSKEFCGKLFVSSMCRLEPILSMQTLQSHLIGANVWHEDLRKPCLHWCGLVCTYSLAHPGTQLACLQDFEALTPNLLARTIETVKAGGIIIMLLSTLTSLTQLYSLTMDVHARFRTESHHNVTGQCFLGLPRACMSLHSRISSYCPLCRASHIE